MRLGLARSIGLSLIEISLRIDPEEGHTIVLHYFEIFLWGFATYVDKARSHEDDMTLL
jgi:hypothetical protein